MNGTPSREPLFRINLDTCSLRHHDVRWVFSLVVAVLLLVPGCTEMKDYTAVYEKYDLEYTSSGYQMANTYEKNANNETVSTTTHVVEIDFSATTPRSLPSFVSD